MSAHEQSITLARHAARAAADKLAEDIVALDVSERLALTDIFLNALIGTLVAFGSMPDIRTFILIVALSIVITFALIL